MFKFNYIIKNFFQDRLISNPTDRTFLKTDNPSEIDIHINPDFHSEVIIDSKAKIGINKNMDIYMWNNNVDHNKVSQAVNTEFIMCIDYNNPNLTLKKISAGMSRQVVNTLLSRLSDAFPRKINPGLMLSTKTSKY
jgi:hypothetical protein